MTRPILFVIDEDTGVLHALRDDLSRRFGEDFGVIGESSAATGPATLRRSADGHQIGRNNHAYASPHRRPGNQLDKALSFGVDEHCDGRVSAQLVQAAAATGPDAANRDA
jgi:hypothetical protein